MARLTRPPRGDGRVIAGVCAGLSEGFGIPVNILRIIFIVFAVTGIGELVYILLWIFMPKGRRGYGY